ncbi:MAG: DNA cytosine methyltransferase [Limnothrix sp. RL_2_0]|nr:DNA cytosine methyltransferase [Limnothrix sp. RL_2_0]
MLRHCELFGGIGGFSHAIEKFYPEHIITLEYCDIDEQAIAVYSRKFPRVRVHQDIRNYFPTEKQFDLITCTFPCTGTSSAGSRTGLNHEESGLWREGFRIMCQVRPRYFVWEQPVGVTTRGLRAIVGASRMAGYQTTGFTVAASELGATHQRERIFIIAYLDDRKRDSSQCWQDKIREQAEEIRDRSRWLSAQSRSHGGVYEFPVGLVRADNWSEINRTFYLVPNGLRRRNDVRRLAAKSVTPAQAAVSLSWIITQEEAR